MSRHRLTVVLSQAPGKHPAKRALEESVAAALIMEPGLDVSIVPHFYDLDARHTGRLFLESVTGDLVVLSWLYPRAAFWLLDRDGIQGHHGESRLKPPADDDEDEEDGEPGASATGDDGKPKGIGAVNPPDRFIYCLDLRDFNTHTPYVEEVRRIAAECRDRHAAKQAARPPALVQIGLPSASRERQRPEEESTPVGDAPNSPGFAPEQLLAPPNRRWYPVIDYGRCTNCLECLDFCLFGVYGVDQLDRIFVESQDSCKKGCPACSRVCPENAIMFPDYKTPAIAGAAVGAAGALKIDLSRLFGGGDGDALTTAVAERDAELVKDGRGAVGMTVGIPKRQADKSAGPKDDLDKLMDDLDALL
jgi:NAD-dependent dihydropyrimidine dehydrogenase PreA subunit